MLNVNRYPIRPLLLPVILLVVLLAACQSRREVRISGKTMGTTYHITVVAGPFTSISRLQKAVDGRLSAINRSMSTYDPASEISRFNAIASTDATFDSFLSSTVRSRIEFAVTSSGIVSMTSRVCF